jgi:hypothetical protein
MKAGTLDKIVGPNSRIFPLPYTAAARILARSEDRRPVSELFPLHLIEARNRRSTRGTRLAMPLQLHRAVEDMEIWSNQRLV